MTSVENLVSRYVAVWNEADPSRRRQAIASLWTEDGAHFTPSLEARGYEAIETRITGAHDRFVRTEGYVFSAVHTGAGHHDAVTFSWEMRPAGGGTVAACGFHFFVLGDDGRIRRDYQFVEAPPPA
ncbi:MAG: nuclear transport factor 2 family protein [Candidatus Rokuibacteriota bacterium]